MAKKFPKVFGITALVLFLIATIVYLYISFTTNKIVCKSTEGNITIMYNNKNLKNYTITGDLHYDFDNQKAYVEKIGVEKYINEFKDWFFENTDGSCK